MVTRSADPATATQDYLHDICSALMEYVQTGSGVGLHSDRHGASLAITFTVADGDQFHELLCVHMAGRMP
jgi:hypothetical protein